MGGEEERVVVVGLLNMVSFAFMTPSPAAVGTTSAIFLFFFFNVQGLSMIPCQESNILAQNQAAMLKISLLIVGVYIKFGLPKL